MQHGRVNPSRVMKMTRLADPGEITIRIVFDIVDVACASSELIATGTKRKNDKNNISSRAR